MAKQVLKDPYIVINGVNLSDHSESVTVNLVKDEIETTNFGGSGRERIAGLKDDSFEITFQQDFASANVDATLYPLWNNETEFVVEVRPVNAAVSATNPKYSGTCILLEYQPLAGDVGELSTTEVTFPSQRTGIARATS
jgi:predicted secreted protein